MHSVQVPLLPFNEFLRLDRHDRLLAVLQALPAERLLRALETQHNQGRGGYAPRVLWACLVAGIVYQIPTIAELRRHLEANPHLRLVCGLGSARVPSAATFSRFLHRVVRAHEQVDHLFTTLVQALAVPTACPIWARAWPWTARTCMPGPGAAKLPQTPTPVGRPKAPRAPARTKGRSTGGSATSCIWR